MGFIVDKNADKEIFDSLDKMNIKYVKSAQLSKINNSTATHPDMQIFFINSYKAIVAPDCFNYYRKILPEKVELIKGTKTPIGTYPDDVPYNVAGLNDIAVANKDFTEEEIRKRIKIINIKQGYAKCSLCITGDKSVITEDKGTAKILKENGFDVCEITGGEVELEGYDYGFIGGASGFDGEKVYFCGDIKTHKDYEKIKKFIKKEIVCLKKGKLIDIGTLVFFGD